MEPPPSAVLGGLVYELDRFPTAQGRRSVAHVRLEDQEADPGFRDRVDLFAFRSRQNFARRVADAFGRQVGEIMGHLAVLVDEIERGLPAEPDLIELTAERAQAAEELLARPTLLDDAAETLRDLGHVGEDEVKRLCFLVATSRLLAKPLSALLLAPSGTGKSTVLDAISALVPPEHVLALARLTPQSLYYQGPDALRNKLVLVDEYEGAGEADHPLRVLQSKGELRLSVTVRGKAESFVVRGPVAVMSGTTATRLDVQNTSRCLELQLDDSPAQTRRIQAAQARAWSGTPRSEPDVELWQDAQRLLRPCEVVIPFATELRFPARTTTDRRSSAKLLGLIAAHALLHQRQREHDDQGRVRASLDDYAAVHALTRALCGALPQGRAGRAYSELTKAQSPLDRRTLAARLGWSYNTAKKALQELEVEELVRIADPGPPARYWPMHAGVLGATELLDPAELAEQCRPEITRAPG